MAKKKNSIPVWLLLITLVTLVATIGLVYLVARPECPSNYTPAQVDESGCIVGANIGAGILSYVVIFMIAGTIALWMERRNKK